MLSIVFLVAWAGCGVIATAVRPDPGESRFAWAPLALFLGPLWVAVAAERQLGDALRPSPVEAGGHGS